MKKLAVYLDLDGVLADYAGGMRQFGFEDDPELNKPSMLLPGTQNAEKRKRYEAVKGTTFYADLPLLDYATDLYNYVADADPIILTASPKFGGTEDDYYLNPYWLGAAYHKRNWVETVLLPRAWAEMLDIDELVRLHAFGDERESRIRIPDERFICTTSIRKQEFIGRKHSEHQILIDDRPDNIERWNAAGGTGILYTADAAGYKKVRETLRDIEKTL